MSKDPAFLFYSADFYMGTVGMSNAQVGQYIRLMCLQHQQGRLTEALVKSVAGNKPDEVVMSKFLQDENGLYYNVRLEKEAAKRSAYVSSRRKNARVKKADTDTVDDGLEANETKHMDEHMQEQTDKHMPEHMENENENVNDNELPSTKKGVAGGNKPSLESRFNVIWMLYPKKQGRSTALNAYKRAVKAGVTDDEIVKGVEAYNAYIQRRSIDTQYIKQGSTFFNQRGWEDEYEEQAKEQEVTGEWY